MTIQIHLARKIITIILAMILVDDMVQIQTSLR